MSRTRLAVTGAIVALVVLVGAVLALSLGGSGNKTLTAYFSRTIGLYKSSSVRILGVPVGKITSITPEGTQVRVVMSYSSKYKLPADVGAVIVPPSIVSDRYVQLTPPYSGGPTLPDHGVITPARTQIPVELDDIFAQMNQLNVALGPNGANHSGSLSRLISVSAANLSGNGAAFNQMLHGFSEAIATLSNNRYDLFGTLTNLQRFTTTLANDDGGVRQVAADLAAVSQQLNGERQDLGAAFRNLSIALGQVASFVRSNRDTLTTDIHQLTSVTSGIVSEKRALAELLDEAPLGLQNLALADDTKYHTLDTRNDNENSQNPCAPTGLLYELTYALNLNCPSSPSGGAPKLAIPSAPSPLSSATGGLSQLLGVLP